MRTRKVTLLIAATALAFAGCSGGGADEPEEDVAPAQVATEDTPEASDGEGDGIFEASAPTAHEACMLFFRHDYRDDDRDEELKVVMGSNIRAAELAYESPIAEMRDTVNADHAEIGMYLLDSAAFIDVCEKYGYEAVEGSSAWFVKETAAGRPPQGDPAS